LAAQILTSSSKNTEEKLERQMLMSSENEYQERILDEGMMIMMRVNLSYKKRVDQNAKKMQTSRNVFIFPLPLMWFM